MLQRIAGWSVVGSGIATGTLLAAAAVYFVVFALSGGLQTALATDAPPEWAFSQYVILSALVVLYLLAAIVFTVSLAALQLYSGPWWAVVVGLGALAVSAGWLLVAGNQTSNVTYARIDALGFVVYMAAANFVGLRARQLNAITAGLRDAIPGSLAMRARARVSFTGSSAEQVSCAQKGGRNEVRLGGESGGASTLTTEEWERL
jgi:hypothetical protein